MIFLVFGAIFGTLVALYMPYHIPAAASQYVAVAILAGLDSVFGGISSSLKDSFKTKIFITGFFGNSIIAALLTYIGSFLDLDLRIAVIVVFGTRIFHNFAEIRRCILKKYTGN